MVLIASPGCYAGHLRMTDSRATNGRNARVCDKCFQEVRDRDGVRDAEGSELKYGLQTIALGLCMGTKADERFSPEMSDGAAGALEAGSLACRLRDELTRHNLRGIKITASNALVANNAAIGLKNQFGVDYPVEVTRKNKEGIKEQRLEAQGQFEFPAYIWGPRVSLRNSFTSPSIDPKPEPTIIVQPVSKTIYFGRVPISQTAAGGQFAIEERMKNEIVQIFSKWKFTSWHVERHRYSRSGGIVNDSWCLKLTPPPA